MATPGVPGSRGDDSEVLDSEVLVVKVDLESGRVVPGDHVRGLELDRSHRVPS